MYQEVNCSLCHTLLSELSASSPECLCEPCLAQQITDLTSSNQSLLDQTDFYSRQLQNFKAEVDSLARRGRSTDPGSLAQKTREKDTLDTLLVTNAEKAQQLIVSVSGLEKSEAAYMQQISSLEKQLFDLSEKSSVAEGHHNYLVSEINRIQSVSLVQDVFQIDWQNEVGKINGLKLGKRIDESGINWDETNAALGQIIQLTQFLKSRLSMEFKLVQEIEVNGQASRLIGRQTNLTFKDSYNIFCQGKEENNFQIGLFLLLQCQKEIYDKLVEGKEVKENLRQYGISEKLPHRILEDHLDELPIYPQKSVQSKWDIWTEALKYFLTNLQHIILIYSVYDELH